MRLLDVLSSHRLWGLWFVLALALAWLIVRNVRRPGGGGS